MKINRTGFTINAPIFNKHKGGYLEDQSLVSVEVQTLEGSKEGKLLFSGLLEKYKQYPAYQGEVSSIGILENGTNSGKPSVIMLVKIELEDSNNNKSAFLVCAEITGQNFLCASQVANTHISKFLRKLNPKAKELT